MDIVAIPIKVSSRRMMVADQIWERLLLKLRILCCNNLK
jgi:hypothetical protein